jgi:hypothetical protein
MSSRFEPTSQQARSIPLLGYREVSAPHAGLFSQLAPVGSDQIRTDLVLAAAVYSVGDSYSGGGGYSVSATVRRRLKERVNLGFLALISY